MRIVRSVAFAMVLFTSFALTLPAPAYIECSRQCRSGSNSCEMASGKSCNVQATSCTTGGACPGGWEDCEFGGSCGEFQWPWRREAEALGRESAP